MPSYIAIKSEALKLEKDSWRGPAGILLEKKSSGGLCRTTPWLHDYAVFMAAKRHLQQQAGISGQKSGIVRTRMAVLMSLDRQLNYRNTCSGSFSPPVEKDQDICQFQRC